MRLYIASIYPRIFSTPFPLRLFLTWNDWNPWNQLGFDLDRCLESSMRLLEPGLVRFGFEVGTWNFFRNVPETSARSRAEFQAFQAFQVKNSVLAKRSRPLQEQQKE